MTWVCVSIPTAPVFGASQLALRCHQSLTLTMKICLFTNKGQISCCSVHATATVGILTSTCYVATQKFEESQGHFEKKSVSCRLTIEDHT